MEKPKKPKKSSTQKEKFEKLMKNGSFMDKFTAGVKTSLGLKLKKGGSVKTKKK
jgi:hypothetical protein